MKSDTHRKYSNTPKTFVVLGMHRSATSVTAQGLSHVVNMNPNGAQFADQPDGNWEDLDFVYLNEAILQAAGGSWDEPPSEEAILSIPTQLKLAVKQLVYSRNNTYKHWGWKDPRTCLTYPIYQPYLRNPILVINWRDPTQVAESLKLRNGFSIEKGLELASIYNDRILAIMESLWCITLK